MPRFFRISSELKSTFISKLHYRLTYILVRRYSQYPVVICLNIQVAWSVWIHRKSREFEPVCSKLSSIFVVVKYRLNLKLFQHGVKSSFINAFTFEIYTVKIKIIKPADLENHYLFWKIFDTGISQRFQFLDLLIQEGTSRELIVQWTSSNWILTAWNRFEKPKSVISIL